MAEEQRRRESAPQHRTPKDMIKAYHQRMQERCVLQRLDDEADAGKMPTNERVSKRMKRNEQRAKDREHRVDDYFDNQANEDIMDHRKLDSMTAEDLYEDDQEGMEVQRDDAPAKHTQQELDALDAELSVFARSRTVGDNKKRLGKYTEESAHPTFNRVRMVVPEEIPFARLFDCEDVCTTIAGAFSEEFEQQVMNDGNRKYADARAFLCLAEPYKFMDAGDETHPMAQWKEMIEERGGRVMHEILEPNGDKKRLVVYAQLSDDIFAAIVFSLFRGEYYWDTHCFLHAKQRPSAF